jgi:KUP system potassium uptake protein
MHEQVAARVPGAAVFMASNPRGVPPVMAHHAKRIRTLHETVVLLTVVVEHEPAVDHAQRLTVQPLGQGVYRLVARVGFMQTPDVPELLADAVEEHGLPLQLEEVTYYLGRETFTAGNGGRMRKLSESLFGFLSRNARPATRYFGIPSEQVVEIGTQIDL